LLAGKVVFITGASRGIGAAAARLFARRAPPCARRPQRDALDRVVAEVRAAAAVADAVASGFPPTASIRAAVDRVEELHGRL
jgi:NAD(P)-dependent dehydrogenase (short-subunit alcohol dehydrogenase family)